MILDSLSNLGQIAGLSPRFAAVVNFIQHTDLQSLALGRHDLPGTDVFANVVNAAPKTCEEARVETHNAMIDLQIPLSGEETMGYTPRAVLPEAPYDEADDISFYDGPADSYFSVKPGMFAVFFPADGHAPAITPTELRKIIFKIPV